MSAAPIGSADGHAHYSDPVRTRMRPSFLSAAEELALHFWAVAVEGTCMSQLLRINALCIPVPRNLVPPGWLWRSALPTWPKREPTIVCHALSLGWSLMRLCPASPLYVFLEPVPPLIDCFFAF
jgi:hypothetical protein